MYHFGKKLELLKNKPRIIFCHSYLDVERTLNLVQYSNSDKKNNVLIIVNTQSLYLFLEDLFRDVENITVKKLHTSTIKLPVLSKIVEKINQQVFLRNLANCKSVNVIFSSMCYIEKEFYFLKKIVKNNMLFYMHDVEFNIKLKRYTNIFKSGLFHFLYGHGISLKRSGSKLISVIDEAFLSNVIEIEGQNTLTDMNNILSFIIYYPYEYLFFSDNLDDFPYIDKSSLFNILDEIKKVLNKNDVLDELIAFKFHPRQQRDDKYAATFSNEIPYYVPSQLIDYPNCRIVFSILSATLFDDQMKDVSKISLLELVKWNNEEKRKSIKHI